MIFEVEVNGRTRTVSVEPAGEAGAPGAAFRVTVDAVLHDVSIVHTELGLAATFAGGRVVDAAITPREQGEWLVQLPHAVLAVTVDRRRHTGGSDAGALSGEQRVSAPMPGRVVRVLVAPGDDVVAGQGLVVVEAMKMENELGSPKAGKVKHVTVSEGVPVEAGRVLVVVE